MRRNALAMWMLAVLCTALPAVAEDAPLPSVDLGGSAGALQLEGLARKSAEEWYGWAGDQLVVSKDGGKSWTGAGRFPQKPIRTLVFPKDGRVFAETAAGKLLSSRDAGATWELSKGWLEPYDFAVAAGRNPGEADGASSPAEFPLDCLLTAPEAVVKVRTGVQAGAPASQGVLELALSSDRASLSGEKRVGEEARKLGARKLSREEALRLTQSLVDAIKRQEEPAGCGASASRTVIEWSCNPVEPWRRKVELRAGECAAAGAYLRGIAVQELASRTLEGSSP